MGEVFKTTFSNETGKNTTSKRFCCGFGDYLGPCWGLLGPKVLILFIVFSVFSRIDFCIDFRSILGPPGTHLENRNPPRRQGQHPL